MFYVGLITWVKVRIILTRAFV